jgi:phosphoglycolate phosphatase
VSKAVRAVVFDLDGTLIDGYDAIHAALTYATGRLGLPTPAPGELRGMVGYGLEALVERVAGAEKAAEGVRLFRERFPQVAVGGSRLLTGVEEVLGHLAAAGYRLSVATNKPPVFSTMILEARGVAKHFTAIVGPTVDRPPKPDPAMLRHLMEVMGSGSEETVCVGDMEVDVAFARAAGCRVIVVPTGSRERTFLEKAGADLLIDDLLSLPAALSAFSS